MKLTKAAIDKLKPDPGGKQKLYWDDALAGFGVLVSGVSSTKTFVVQRKLARSKTRRVTIGPVNVFKVEDARDRANKVLAQFADGVDPKIARRAEAAAARTLRSAIDAYLTNVRLRPKSRKTYAGTVRHLTPWLDRPLRGITREAVASRHREIAAEVAAQRPEVANFSSDRGTVSANLAMRFLRAVWNHAALADPTLGPNPVKLPRAWFSEPRRERIVPIDRLPEFYSAVEAVPNQVARDYLKLILTTGLRLSEAASLRWEDVTLPDPTKRTGGLIHLRAEVTKTGGKTGAFDLPMSDVVADLLTARRATGIERGGWVFPANSKSGHLAEPKSPLAAIARDTGITVSVHDLRRTFISIAESTPGVSFLAVKMLVNHAKPRDVTAGYVILGPNELRAAANLVADRLKELCGIAEPAGANVRGWPDNRRRGAQRAGRRQALKEPCGMG
jgi:integrase